MLRTIALALLLLVPGVALAATAEDVDQAVSDNLGDPTAFHEAFDAIQQAVTDDDPAELADWVQFPINVRLGDKAVTLHDADEFEAAYPELFTDSIKDAITGQAYEDLFVNYSGAMFGNGQIWVAGVCKTDTCDDADMRIITIQEAADK